MEQTTVVALCGEQPLQQRLTEAIERATGLCLAGMARSFPGLPGLVRSARADVVIVDLKVPGTGRIGLAAPDAMTCALAVVSASMLAEHGAAPAVAYVERPDTTGTSACFERALLQAIRAVAREVASCTAPATVPIPDTAPDADAPTGDGATPALRTARPALIVIGASTGGNEALTRLFSRLEGDLPPIMIVQHIPAAFAAGLARRLDQCSPVTTLLASDGERLRPGHAYISPGEQHLQLERDGGQLRARFAGTERVNGHCPSVDVLFESAAALGPRALAVLLTGMGNDGARGMLTMHEAGARTIVQDEASSVVWGMPGRAFELGAADMMLPLDRIHRKVIEFGCKR